mmetsp:Transcript_46292/g.149164  ORF Transcript_46292/g.149164 Transcript_46292/m.149164 type:complete len:215 (-) Transcript_46292:135-779(-)
MGPHRRRPHQPQPGVRSQPLPQNRARAASATPRPRQEPLRRMWATQAGPRVLGEDLRLLARRLSPHRRPPVGPDFSPLGCCAAAADANHADAAAREAAGPQRAGPGVAALALVAALAPHFAAARPPAARFASLRVCHSHRLAADPTEHDLGEGGPRPSAHCPSAARTAADGAGPTPAHDGALCLLRAAGRGGPGHLIALCMCVSVGRVASHVSF